MPDNKYKDRRQGGFRRDNFRSGGNRYGQDRRGGSENRDDKRQRFMQRARGGVRTAYVASAADHSIIQAINAYVEVDKMLNILYERLEEWYGAYFPGIRLNNHETYARLVSRISSRNDVDESVVQEIVGDGTPKVLELIRSSRGFADIDSEEYKGLKALAEEELRLVELQKNLDAFLAVQTKKVMPNITYLIDYKIAAQMLGKAGSLERFANMPASTIQLLGAERALFKHLKFGGRPPKYGYLFKLPELATVNKKEKGRLARIYATKLGIAARADAFSKRFIADTLKAQLEKARARRVGTNSEE